MWTTGRYIRPNWIEALPISQSFWNCYACEQERARVEAILPSLDDKDPRREELLRLFEGCQLTKLRELLTELEA